MKQSSSATRILIFDSGVGGLSILNAVRKHLPHCEYIYACDNEAFPYGTKTEAELVPRVEKVLKALVAKEQPNLIVIACNTASTVALPLIRSHFTIPVVGVVPAIKPAAQLSQSKVIGLLGTPATVERDYTQQLIDDFANDCQIIKVGSSELVHIAEQKMRGEVISSCSIAQIIQPFLEQPQLDCIVLACTHFPLLTEELQQVSKREIVWVDSGDAIARRVQSLLKQTSGNSTKQGFKALFTSHHDTATLQQSLNTFGCNELDLIQV